MLTFGSLFAGIGGIDLGLERSGMSCKWQVEKDEWCRKVLAKHWPAASRFGDIREFSGEAEVASADLICGGFPCQPVSYSGKRKAQGDERWLWPEFSRVLRKLRPRFVIIENVPGLLTAGASGVVFDLAEIGYDAEWRVLAAEDFGAPHKRERLFIVGWQREEGFPPGWFAGASVADFNHSRQQQSQRPAEEVRGRPGGSIGKAADSWLKRLEGGARSRLHREGRQEVRPDHRAEKTANPDRQSRAGFGHWEFEPGVVRLVHGLPRVVDRRERIQGLGNAVVPQVAEFVGSVILNQLEQP